MMRYKLSLLLALLVVCNGLHAQSGSPTNLSEAIAYFQKEWPQRELDSFRRAPEAIAVAREHYSTGSWIRDTWVRGNGPFRAYFDSLGVSHPDDMSTIVLTSLHRTLNKKDPGLAKQVAGHKEYWSGITACDEKLRAQALADYNKYAEGQEITIYFPVDTASGPRNAVVYNCPRPDWKFDAKRDLIVKGQIVRKFTDADPNKVFFEIRITSLNRTDTPILYEKIAVGGTKKLALYSLRIE